MKLYITKPDDRDTVLMILGRNGYTIRQGTEKPEGQKKSVSYVEVLDDGRKQ
ncbi:MAG: hypothetical protein IJ955_06910 [Oscillospiraceae bacterium]|nr:hypothetical protein [Oscillospiraceae bacterium]